MTDSYVIPADLLYTKEHEWTRLEGSLAKVGITDYAAKTLNDVVYVSLPASGARVTQLESFGTIESIKAVSELYSPVSGIIKSINTELLTHPELVNKSPYGEGWIMEIETSNLDAERKALMSPGEYAQLITSLGK